MKQQLNFSISRTTIFLRSRSPSTSAARLPASKHTRGVSGLSKSSRTTLKKARIPSLAVVPELSADHPHGRKIVFVGDLVDRGPNSPGVVRLVMDAVASGAA